MSGLARGESVKIFLFGVAALVLFPGNNLAPASNLQGVQGVTRRVPVRAVSQPWSATLAVPAPARQKLRAAYLGHFPGFHAAKKQANQAAAAFRAARQKSAAPFSSSTTSSPSLSPEAPSALPIFKGPGESDTTYIPPDPQIAAGPNYLVVAINSLLAIYDKTGAQQGSFQDLSAFFSSLGLTGEIFDPRILYDQADNRYILSAAEVDMANLTNGHVLLAVSETSDPTGAWYKYAIDFMGRNISNTANTYPDFPTLGLSSSVVYISTSQFAFTSACLANDTCSFSDTWIKVIGLRELLQGYQTLNVTTFQNVMTASRYPAFAVEPALTYGSAPGEFLVAASFNSNPGSTLNVFEINTSGTPVLSAADLAVPQFQIPPDAVQPGTGYGIATNDFRLLNAVWANGSLWCGQNVQQTSGSGVAARWYQIADSSLSTLALTQSGDVTGNGDAYYPSLSVKANGDVGMVFTTSSSTQFASAAFTGRAESDPPGTMRYPSLYWPGADDYVDFATRWGDYSGISLDPDGSSMWFIAEFADRPNPHFGTAIAEAGGPPALAISSSVLDFGSQPVPQPSAPKSVTIANNLTTTLTLGSATISGFNASNFAITSDGCSNVTLSGGQSCSLSVTFTPSTTGIRSAVLQINTNPAGLPEQVYLTGVGTPPNPGLTLSPTNILFPNTPIGTASAPQAVQVTNTGTSAEALEISVGSPFTQTNNCGPSLDAGKTCQINVTFRPTGVMEAVGDLRVSYPGFPPGTSIPDVSLTGTGVTAPGATLCPLSVTFGSQTVGTASSPQLVTLNNSGTSNLTISGISLSGDFSQVNTCGSFPAILGAGNTCTINITFSPKAAGTRTGTLTVRDSAAGSPQAAQLTGTGVASSGQFFLPPQDLFASNLGPKEIGPLPLTARPGRHAASASRLAATRYGDLPLSFEANAGQSDPRVRFLSRGAGYLLFLTKEEAVLELSSPKAGEKSRAAGKNTGGRTPPLPSQSEVIKMALAGGNADVSLSGLEELAGKVNYFIGDDPSKWKTGVPLYAKVRYRKIYPGTDLDFYGNHHRLEYDFVLAPGANPRAIRFRIAASDAASGSRDRTVALRIANDGDLVIQTAAGQVRFRKPVVYQLSAGPASDPATLISGPRGTSAPRRYIDGLFALRKVSGQDYEVSFRLAHYDHSRPLVIDPVLSYSSYLGGSDRDEAKAIALDASGSAYVAGLTGSADFPVSNPLQPKINRTLPYTTDAFITKLSPDGTSLVYSTYLGGAQSDFGLAVAVDSQGNAYVAGNTGSSDFPVTTGAFQTTLKGGTYAGDGFLAKINATGSALVYSTYFGGSEDDVITSLAVDSSQDAYIAGVTNSPDLPTTPGVLQSGYAGPPSVGCYQDSVPGESCGDAFVAEINPQGTGLVYSTYLGGSNDDYASSIAVDSTGSVYVVGTTNSLDFPTTPGAFQTGWMPPGTYEAFVAKLRPLGAGLAYLTYLKVGDIAGVAIDAQGAAYVAGSANPDPFPGVNSLSDGRPVFPTASQAFVAKVHPAGCGLVYAATFGGFQYTSANAIAIDSAGDAYVTGFTTDFDFPVLNPFQASYRQATVPYSLPLTAFVTKLGPSGSSILYSSYLGGSKTDLPPGYGGGDIGSAIAVDSSGNAYVAGKTNSIDFPIVSGADSTYGGNGDAFVTKIAPTVVPSITLNPAYIIFPETAIGATSAPLPVTVTNTTSNPVTISSVAAFSGNSGFAVANNGCNTSLQPNASCTFSVTFSPPTGTSVGLDWSVVTVNDNAFAGPHSVSVYGTAYTPPHILLYVPESPVNFGSVPVGGKSLIPVQASITNSGSQTLTISGIAVTGDFTQTNNCSSSLSQNGSCNVNLTFAPTAAGTRTGTLTVTGNAANSPQVVSLTGIGQDFSMGVSSGASSSATINPGQSATYSLSITSTTGFPPTISLACTGAPSQSTCAVAPNSVTLSGTTPANVTLRVSTTGQSAVPGGVRFEVPRGFGFPGGWFTLLAALLLAVIALGSMAPGRGRARWETMGFAVVALLVLLWVACGGGGGGFTSNPSSPPPPTPAGTYTLTVTATAGTLSHATSLGLTVQ